MANIFISNVSQDAEFATALSERLNQIGHETFYAADSITLGQNWKQFLERSLKEADAVVVVVSEESISGDSLGGLSKWLTHEVAYALGYWRETGKPIVLPVLIDDIDIPPPLNEIQTLYAPERNINYIVERLSASIETSLGRINAREELKREKQKRVEDVADRYIDESIEELKDRERKLKRSANIWYGVAFFSLFLGLAFAVWRALPSSNSSLDSWLAVVPVLLASLILVGFSGAISRFSFMLGKSYMVESLRNSDRIHAISFGRFYLKAYGERAEWEEIKEAFQHWNIDKGSAFIGQDIRDVDPKLLKTAVDIAKALSFEKTSK